MSIRGEKSISYHQNRIMIYSLWRCMNATLFMSKFICTCKCYSSHIDTIVWKRDSFLTSLLGPSISTCYSSQGSYTLCQCFVNYYLAKASEFGGYIFFITSRSRNSLSFVGHLIFFCFVLFFYLAMCLVPLGYATWVKKRCGYKNNHSLFWSGEWSS